MTKFLAASIASLKGKLKGEVILLNDDSFKSARKVWNATIDKHPALIVRRTTARIMAR